MIPELKTLIEKTIEMLLPIEENKWIIYEKCKGEMRSFEIWQKVWLNLYEWREHIIYITDKLEI